MKSRIKKRKPRKGTAVNDRKSVYKYFPVDDTHSIAVKGGRCYKCSKITTEFCQSCLAYVCDNHSEGQETDRICLKCKKESRSLPSYIG